MAFWAMAMSRWGEKKTFLAVAHVDRISCIRILTTDHFHASAAVHRLMSRHDSIACVICCHYTAFVCSRSIAKRTSAARARIKSLGIIEYPLLCMCVGRTFFYSFFILFFLASNWWIENGKYPLIDCCAMTPLNGFHRKTFPFLLLLWRTICKMYCHERGLTTLKFLSLWLANLFSQPSTHDGPGLVRFEFCGRKMQINFHITWQSAHCNLPVLNI